jgi:hypothetical protein
MAPAALGRHVLLIAALSARSVFFVAAATRTRA